MSEVRTRFTDEISRERPRIIVRIRKSRLGAKFCRQLWKNHEEKVRSRYRSQETIETAVMDTDNTQILYWKYDRCEESVRNDAASDSSLQNCDRNNDCDSTSMVCSRATHYKKTIIEKHRKIARKSPEPLDLQRDIFSNRNESAEKDLIEKEDVDSDSIKDDRFDEDQEETESNSESTSSSTATALTDNSSGTDLAMPTENKRKIMVLENMMIASPSTTTSLPDQSITKSSSPEQNKTAVGKHILPTVFIPQQKYTRVAMPLNINCPNLLQNLPEKPDVEENLNPNYPNFGTEAKANSDDRNIKAKQPSGTVRRKMTIPVRRKSTVVDENQRRDDGFNKEIGIPLQEMNHTSNTRHNGLDLLSSVCATRHEPQQEQLNNLRQNQISNEMEPQTFQTNQQVPTEENPYVIQLENSVSAVIPPRITSRINNKVVSAHKQSPQHNLINNPFDSLMTEAHHKLMDMHPPITEAANSEMISPAYRRSTSWQPPITPTSRPADHFQPYNRSISMPQQPVMMSPHRTVDNSNLTLSPRERYISSMHQANQQALVPNPPNEINHQFNKNRNNGQEPQILQQLWHQRMQMSKRHIEALKEAKMQQSNMIMPNRERSTSIDGNPQKYPSMYHNIPAQNTMYHGMFHPAYYQSHMVLPNTPIENSQEDLLANELLNQQIAAQIRNQQIHQMNEANRQNMYQSMYNNPMKVQQPLIPPNTPSQNDFNRRQLTLNKRRSPPPYNGKHFVVNRPKQDPKEINKQQTETQSNLISQPKQDLNQKCQQESNETQIGIRIGSEQKEHVKHPPPPNNQIKKICLNPIMNAKNNDRDNRNKSTNRLRQEFLDKIYVYQKYLTIQQFTEVLPKIPYSRDFSVYPYIVQEIEKIISNLPPPPSNNANVQVPQTQEQTQSLDQPSTYPLNPELVEKLLQNETTIKDPENESVVSKDKTSPNAEIDSQNQVCTLYYESQDDKIQPEATKQTVIIAEESPKQNKIENTSSANSLLRNGQNYTTLLKLIDLVASTEHDRLLGQALLRYYPDEVLQITMARVDDKLSTFGNLVSAAEAKRQNDKNLKCKQVHEIIKPPDVTSNITEIVPNCNKQPLQLTVKIPEIEPKMPRMLRLKPKSYEPEPKAQQILSNIDKSASKIADIKPKSDEPKPQAQEILSNIDKSASKIADITANIKQTIPKTPQILSKRDESLPKILDHQLNMNKPKIPQIQLKMDESNLKESTPKSPQILPNNKIDESPPKVQQIQLKIDEPKLTITEPKTKTDELTPKISESASKIKELTPKLELNSLKLQNSNIDGSKNIEISIQKPKSIPLSVIIQNPTVTASTNNKAPGFSHRIENIVNSSSNNNSNQDQKGSNQTNTVLKKQNSSVYLNSGDDLKENNAEKIDQVTNNVVNLTDRSKHYNIGSENNLGNLRKGVIVKLETNTSIQKPTEVTTPPINKFGKNLKTLEQKNEHSKVKILDSPQKPPIITKKLLELDQDTECMMEAKELEVLLKATSPKSFKNKVRENCMEDMSIVETIDEHIISDEDSSEMNIHTDSLSEDKVFERTEILLREKPDPVDDKRKEFEVKLQSVIEQPSAKLNKETNVKNTSGNLMEDVLSTDKILTKNEPNSLEDSPVQNEQEKTCVNPTLHNYPLIPFGSITEETPIDNCSINPGQHDIRLIHEASETSFQTIQTSSSSDIDSCNSIPSIPSISHQETNTETDSTDDEPKDLEIKREYLQYESKHLSHNFLFDVKFGPEDDIESIYARIMPSCFMILNLVHEMQNMNNINWWPVDTVGNLMKIKRSLRGIGTFLKRSKKLAAYLNPCIHHFFIFLLQCFGTFRERVKRILDNGFAMKENYISASEGDIYRDVFIQLYDYLCCNRVTEYANFIIKRDESVNRKNKSDQNQSNQLNSFQPIKSFSSVHQKHMLIIEQLKQRRTAEEEKNEDFKNFISHLGNSNQMSSDDQNNNTQLDDVIIIPDAEDSNADSNPRENLKRKIELIILDSDSEEDAEKKEIKKQKISSRKNTSYNIADIINLIDEDDLSNDNEKLESNQQVNNKRQSVEDYTEMHKKLCGDANLEISLKHQSEDQSFLKETETKNSDEIHLQVNTKLKDDIKNETETGESIEKTEPYEETGKTKINLQTNNEITLKTDIPKNEIKGEKDQIPVVQQSNPEKDVSANQNEEQSQIGNEPQIKNNVEKEENVIKMEAQNKEKESHEADNNEENSKNMKINIAKPSDRSENANLDNSETIEAIQNYLRETDSIIQENHSEKYLNSEEIKSATPNQRDSDSDLAIHNDKSMFSPSKNITNENKVIGVAIPNVKDVTNSGNDDDSVEDSCNADGYISDQNDDDSIDNKKKIIKEIYRHQLTKQKDNKSTTQKLIHFRKPSKKIENKHSNEHKNESTVEKHETCLQNEDPQDCSILNKDQEKCVPQEKANTDQVLSGSRRGSQDISAPIEHQPLPNIPNENLNETPTTNHRRISIDQSPIQLKTRRISLESHKNGSATTGNHNQHYNHINGWDNSDSFNIQAKAAISEYFDAQRIVARQIAAPIHPDITLRNLENNSKSTTAATGIKEVSKHKQIQSDGPHLQPPPANSKELLRQAVIKRHLSNSQSSTQALPVNTQKSRTLPTPIPTLQSIYNDEINTNGFISQYIKDEIGVLSKKESLGPGEYVLEVNTLKRLPLIPKDFKEFYIFVTKQQILQLHQPITFYIFLELLNQSGLKDYHKKFTEYTKRKYEDRLSFKKREQPQFQQHQIRHNT